MYIPIPRDRPSRDAQELAEHLDTTLGEYLDRHPNVSDKEVRQALRMLTEATEPATNRIAIKALGLGLVAAGGIGAFVLQDRGANDSTFPLVVAVAIFAALIAMVVMLRNR